MDDDPASSPAALSPDRDCAHGIRHRGVHSCDRCCRSPEAQAADDLAALTEEPGLYGEY